MPGAVCPPEMANIDDRFCIDRWEGSLVEVMRDGRDVPWPPYGPLEEGHALRAVSVAERLPAGVHQRRAGARACAAAGKRLCAPVEWRKACMGPRRRRSATASSARAGKCNDAGYSPMLRSTRRWRRRGGSSG